MRNPNILTGVKTVWPNGLTGSTWFASNDLDGLVVKSRRSLAECHPEGPRGGAYSFGGGWAGAPTASHRGSPAAARGIRRRCVVGGPPAAQACGGARDVPAASQARVRRELRQRRLGAVRRRRGCVLPWLRQACWTAAGRRRVIQQVAASQWRRAPASMGRCGSPATSARCVWLLAVGRGGIQPPGLRPASCDAACCHR